MKKAALAVLATTLSIGLLAACREKPKEYTKENTKEVIEVNNVEMNLDSHEITVSEWKEDGSHLFDVNGHLTADGKPVVGAKIQISERRIMETDKMGEFYLTADRNNIGKNIVRVIDVSNATVDGKKLDSTIKDSLLALEEEVVIHYPIVVDKAEQNEDNPDLVDVYAKAQILKGENFPKFGTYKYRIAGTIRNYKGNPVEGATVNIRRDGVEGFSMSDPSDENGEFAMYYIPEDDENHYFYVQIPSKDISYSLPENRAFLFPDDIGVNIDIRLPESGTVIDDTLKNLVATTEPGSLQRGVLIGINTEEEYKISVPKTDGSFKLTISKAEWDKNPGFYEVNYQEFNKEEIGPGYILSSSQIPMPGKFDPTNIQPMN